MTLRVQYSFNLGNGKEMDQCNDTVKEDELMIAQLNGPLTDV